MKRAAHIALALAPVTLTLITLLWFLTQSPFAAPMVDRTTAQTRAAIARMMAQEVDLDGLLPRVQEALIAENLEQLDLLLGVANDYGMILPRDLVEDIAALDAQASGFWARTTACGACAVDVTACQTLGQIGACALPFELTPAGDVNALRRGAVDYASGAAVDQLDVGLAVVGLAATGTVLATGGSSYTIKAGTSLLRMARRLGTLTPAFAARLTGLMGDVVRWDRMGDFARLRIPAEDLVDAGKLGELGTISTSLRRVSDKTSVAETVSLLRYVDDTADAARLARVTDAMGPQTRGAFEVLGKSRVMRATVRLSDVALGAAAAIYVLGLQVVLFLSQQCGNLCLRGLRRVLS